jgi:hypothetical protein
VTHAPAGNLRFAAAAVSAAIATTSTDSVAMSVAFAMFRAPIKLVVMASLPVIYNIIRWMGENRSRVGR